MPRVAGKLNAGIASDISKVEVAGGKLQYKRPVYAGNVYATVEVTTPDPAGKRSSVGVRAGGSEPAARAPWKSLPPSPIQR